MTKAAKAIAAHQAKTTPAAIRRTLAAAKGKPYATLITAAGIRAGAADELREALAAEAGR
jgi:hypothetical protein